MNAMMAEVTQRPSVSQPLGMMAFGGLSGKEPDSSLEGTFGRLVKYGHHTDTALIGGYPTRDIIVAARGTLDSFETLCRSRFLSAFAA